MKKINTRVLFLVICVALALLLLTKVIKIFVSGILFAIALVTLGLLSRGFTKRS